ncbi:MAG TPA: UDP-glucose 4-epimerase GalE [Jatrophihabitans sp.]|nr:UDP-glucose 4-epimerase GalE [Jatrophihabitans sp.]
MTILVTGGAGYIGSHTVLALLREGAEVVVVDNLSNSSRESLDRVQELARRPLEFAELDLRDEPGLRKVFDAHPISGVIHFAGLKAVGESVEFPLRYYDNNIGSSVSLLRVMDDFGVRQLVFSSSATVYGNAASRQLVESMPLAPINPYGQTKAMIEQILRDVAATGPGWQIVLLRYFNPVGADPSGRIGEDPTGTPNNLLPFIAQVAVGRRPELQIFGDDYDTPDGTGIRDYIHVADVADGHLAALRHLPAPGSAEAVNLGTGRGSSVLEVVAAFEQASGRQIPRRVVARRPGDLAAAWADAGLARERFGWQATRTLSDACADAWRWQSANPEGYRSAV